ncbi:hypothetical protein [Egicoccus sp. AB-alg2]|uniref:fluoroquinolone export ABC transporter permease subunit n=1 Tax=Egicoccus sp. AB-alg2 TaxID=3242693 RepID=UPI00359E3BC5
MTGTLVPLLRLDATLLARHGVVAAVAVVTATWAGLLAALPPTIRADLAAPALYLDAAIVGLLFLGGMVLIERRQGSLEALAVAPVRPATYVASKVASLTVLALAATAVIVVVARPGTVRWAALLAGVLLLSVPVLLFALVVVARAATVTGYLFGLQGPLLPAALPLVVTAGWLPSWSGWLSPTHGPYLLLRAGVGGPLPSPTATVAAVLGAVVTSVVLGRLAVVRVSRDLLRAGRL